MGFQKGNSYGGRKPGAGNKTTTQIKEAYQQLLESNLDNMTIWLGRVADKNPDKAVDLMLRLSEYILPKLARTESEITGKDGKDLFKDITFTFNTAKKEDGEK